MTPKSLSLLISVAFAAMAALPTPMTTLWHPAAEAHGIAPGTTVRSRTSVSGNGQSRSDCHHLRGYRAA